MNTTSATMYGAIFFQSIFMSFNQFANFTEFFFHAEEDVEGRLTFVRVLVIIF